MIDTKKEDQHDQWLFTDRPQVVTCSPCSPASAGHCRCLHGAMQRGCTRCQGLRICGLECSATRRCEVYQTVFVSYFCHTRSPYRHAGDGESM